MRPRAACTIGSSFSAAERAGGAVLGSAEYPSLVQASVEVSMRPVAVLTVWGSFSAAERCRWSGAGRWARRALQVMHALRSVRH